MACGSGTPVQSGNGKWNGQMMNSVCTSEKDQRLTWLTDKRSSWNVWKSTILLSSECTDCLFWFLCLILCRQILDGQETSVSYIYVLVGGVAGFTAYFVSLCDNPVIDWEPAQWYFESKSARWTQSSPFTSGAWLLKGQLVQRTVTAIRKVGVGVDLTEGCFDNAYRTYHCFSVLG